MYAFSISMYLYSTGKEKSPLLIFLHDQLPFGLGETGRNSGQFLQEIQYITETSPCA